MNGWFRASAGQSSAIVGGIAADHGGHGGETVSTVRVEAPEASRGTPESSLNGRETNTCRQQSGTGRLTNSGLSARRVPASPGTGIAMQGAPAGMPGPAGQAQLRIGPRETGQQGPTVPNARCWLRSETPAWKPHGTGVRLPPPPPGAPENRGPCAVMVRFSILYLSRMPRQRPMSHNQRDRP